MTRTGLQFAQRSQLATTTMDRQQPSAPATMADGNGGEVSRLLQCLLSRLSQLLLGVVVLSIVAGKRALKAATNLRRHPPAASLAPVPLRRPPAPQAR